MSEVHLPGSGIKRMHVNQFRIKEYHKTHVEQPVLILRTSGNRALYGTRFDILDKDERVVASLLQSLAKPMPGCGARVWVETRYPVLIHAAESYTGCDLIGGAR